MMRVEETLLALSLCFYLFHISATYSPNWNSLDSRPLPKWYDEAKLGIMIHWGVYSVPGFHSEWFWKLWKDKKDKDCVQFMEDNYPPHFSYQEFANSFLGEFFDPKEWAEIIKNSGAKYVVFTSKHHDGYTLWPSIYSYSWNAKDIGPHRDVISELAAAIRKENLYFGLYHSLYEWFNPLYLADKNAHYNETNFTDKKLVPEMHELIEKYKPDILWSDGDSEAQPSYWKSEQFLAWLYNTSPVKDTIVVNDRWGYGTPCKHGGFYTCKDQYNPKKLQKHKWESAVKLDKKSWGYRRQMKLSDLLTIEDILTTLAEVISCGGNLLLNVGPTSAGMIDPMFQQLLKDLGDWMKINGEAVYESKPWEAQNDTTSKDVWYTKNNNSVYAIVLKWPKNNKVKLGSVGSLFKSKNAKVQMLGEKKNLKWRKNGKNIEIDFPNMAEVRSTWAWVLKIKKV